MWRRILRIPFEHVVPKERRSPALKLALKDTSKTGPAILAWAVEGCLRWQENGLQVPTVVEQATEQYRLDMDPLREFIEDKCILHTDAWIAAATLRSAYEMWARESGERRTLEPKAMAERLRQRGCVQANRKVLGNSTRGWEGIGLRVQSEVDG
jgi:putative DNA primase/helicase